jgi:hypothetical protein
MKKSGLLDREEKVIAYVNGFTLSLSTSPLRLILQALASPYRPSSWRAVVLTDQQLYICSLRGGRPGKLKSVLASYPRGSYAASITDGDRQTSLLEVEGVSISCPSKGRMRRSADVIVEAGGRGEGAAE